jgi:hypothetical protein
MFKLNKKKKPTNITTYGFLHNIVQTIIAIYCIIGNFCGQLRTAEIKIAEYYVK